jgi:hypothetical protein
MARQLPGKERLQLISLLQMEELPPTKEEFLDQLKEDYKRLKNGTLKTTPLKDFLHEI